MIIASKNPETKRTKATDILRRTVNAANTISKVIIVILVVWLVVIPAANYVITRYIDVKPLGSKLDFLGKSDNGCPMYLFPCLFAPPSYEYHYGTSLKPWELTTYFKGAEQTGYHTPWSQSDKDIWLHSDSSAAYSPTCYTANYSVKSTKKPFSIKLCPDGKSEISAHRLRNTDEPYVLSINTSEYEATKSSL